MKNAFLGTVAAAAAAMTVSTAVLFSSAASAEIVHLDLTLSSDGTSGSYLSGLTGSADIDAGFTMNLNTFYDSTSDRYISMIETAYPYPIPTVGNPDSYNLSVNVEEKLRSYSFSYTADGKEYSGSYHLANENIRKIDYSISDSTGALEESFNYDTWGGSEIYTHTFSDGTTSSEKFDHAELFNTVQDTTPVSGYGMFDFQTTLINYKDGSSVSLSHIIGSNDLLDFQFGGTGVNESLWGPRWYSDSPILSINVATIYAAVPEPETWAMLLAGLGLVGAMARRRKQRA